MFNESEKAVLLSGLQSRAVLLFIVERYKASLAAIDGSGAMVKEADEITRKIVFLPAKRDSSAPWIDVDGVDFK